MQLIEITEDVFVPIFGRNNTDIIKKSLSSYKAVGIYFYCVNHSPLEKILEIAIHQKELLNGFILTNKQLHERARKVFDFPTDYKIHIYPYVFEPPFGDITAEWIKEKMSTIGVSKRALMKQLRITGDELGQILSNQLDLDNVSKSAVFYYFLQFEINRDLRKLMNLSIDED